MAIAGVKVTSGVPELFSESIYPHAGDPNAHANESFGGPVEENPYDDLAIYSSLPPDFLTSVMEAPTLENWVSSFSKFG